MFFIPSDPESLDSFHVGLAARRLTAESAARGWLWESAQVPVADASVLCVQFPTAPGSARFSGVRGKEEFRAGALAPAGCQPPP